MCNHATAELLGYRPHGLTECLANLLRTSITAKLHAAHFFHNNETLKHLSFRVGGKKKAKQTDVSMQPKGMWI